MRKRILNFFGLLDVHGNLVKPHEYSMAVVLLITTVLFVIWQSCTSSITYIRGNSNEVREQLDKDVMVDPDRKIEFGTNNDTIEKNKEDGKIH